jgi:hypothetical protein
MDHPAPLRAEIDGEEYPRRGDPEAFARSLIEMLDSLSPEERLEFHKLAELDRHDGADEILDIDLEAFKHWIETGENDPCPHLV